MRKSFYFSLFVILSGSLAAQTKNARSWNGSKIVFEGQPASIRLAPHVTTTIRLPEPVNSVIVGDPTLFQAEYSPNEPLLVFANVLFVLQPLRNAIEDLHGSDANLGIGRVRNGRN